jgi:hypothetical protein
MKRYPTRRVVRSEFVVQSSHCSYLLTRLRLPEKTSSKAVLNASYAVLKKTLKLGRLLG